MRHSLTHSSWHVCVDVASRTIRLNTSLFWASLPDSVGLICSHFLMSSVHLLVGRPFLLLPSSLTSNMCLSRESCLFRSSIAYTYLKSYSKLKKKTYAFCRTAKIYLKIFVSFGIFSVRATHTWPLKVLRPVLHLFPSIPRLIDVQHSKQTTNAVTYF